MIRRIRCRAWGPARFRKAGMGGERGAVNETKPPALQSRFGGPEDARGPASSVPR